MKTVKYRGVTRLLTKPKEANGKKYPFAFDSDMPQDLFTSYRLVKTSVPGALTDAALAAMLRQCKHDGLTAELDRYPKPHFSWITIYPETDADAGSSDSGITGQFEEGPRLEPTKDKGLKMPEPPRPPASQPEPEPDMEMGW